MRGIVGLLLTCLLLLTAGRDVVGATYTYYVTPKGRDTANGSLGAPWKTIQRAADEVRPGDTVVVRAGTYAGFVLGWEKPQSGTESRRITFRAEPGAVINARNVKTRDGINLENCNFVTIEGFTIQNPGGSIDRSGIRTGGRSKGVIIRNNKVDACGVWGIFTSFADSVLIENNVTSHSKKEHGIYVSNACTRPAVRGNTCFGNRKCGIHLNGDQSQGSAGTITGAIIEGNIIYDNGKSGGSGINCDGVQNSVIRNNLLYDNHASGISLYKIDASAGATDNLIVNNTVLMAKDGRWALNLKGGSTGNIVFNNILYAANPNRGSITIAADSLPGFVSDHNVVIDRFCPVDDETRQTLAQWQAATGQDRHSLVAVPNRLFLDPTGNNFHLRADSPALDKGVESLAGRKAPEKDLRGTPRPSGTGYDIGAFEEGSGRHRQERP